MFDEFAEIEYAAAQLGIDPDVKELWELSCAFGAHRVDLPFGADMGGSLPFGAPSAGSPLGGLPDPTRLPTTTPFVANTAHAEALRALIDSEQHAQQSGDRAEWAEPSDAELIALRPLLRGGG